MSQQEAEKPVKALNCGSCANLNREKVFEAKCSELGKIPTSRACRSHAPDAFTLMQDQETRLTSLVEMGRVFRRMSPNDLQILAALLLNEKRTRRAGYSFMQKVYIRISGSSGRNYLSNFVMGYVLDADKDQVRIVSETGLTAVTLPKGSPSLYTVEQFEPVRAEIFANKRWVDQDVKADAARLSSRVLADLDQADVRGDLDTKSAKRKKIKKVKHAEDLVSFVAKMTRGVISTKKAHQAMDEEITINWG